MNPITHIPVYCPVCGYIQFVQRNALDEPVYPDHIPNGSCMWCQTQMLPVAEPFENFYQRVTYSGSEANEKKFYEMEKYIRDNYILQNPLYNPKAHFNRFKLSYANTNMLLPTWKMELKECFNTSYMELVHMIKKYPSSMPAYTPLTPSQPKCPHCGSESIVTMKKGFGVGKAAAGVVLTGDVTGALAGGIGANKVVNVCQNCGHQWEPGK